MRLTIPILVPEKIAEATFKTDVRFKTKAKVTKRTVDVSEAFGIGVDEEHHFVVYDNFTVEINKGNIVYITGDSGSGKSLLLKELATSMLNNGNSEFGRIITDREVERKIDSEKPIIEQVGRNTNEAINILSIAGLNEAFLMLRKYSELSDGQKYRFRLAKMIDSGANTWMMDEFASVLDRTTAKVVAYTIQKAARRLGRTLIVATTHTDLERDLNPNLRIFKHFGFKVDVKYRKVNSVKPCSLLRKVIIEKGSKRDFEELEQFHYRHGSLIIKAIYRAVLDGKVTGVIVYASPYLNLRARSVVLPQFTGKTTPEHARKINKHFVRIARVVVDPKYRSIGLGVKLVKDTLARVGYPYVEILAVMGQYNPFAVKAGMLNVPMEFYANYDKGYLTAVKRLQEIGFSPDMFSSKIHNLRVLKHLSKNTINEVKHLVASHFISAKFRKPGLKEKVLGGDLGAISSVLAGHRLPYAYAIWKNPRFKKYPKPMTPIYLKQ